MVGGVRVEPTLNRSRGNLQRLTARGRLDRLEVQALRRAMTYEPFDLLGNLGLEGFFEAPFLAASASEAASGDARNCASHNRSLASTSSRVSLRSR
jgi:hypothetical protein